MSDLVPRNNLEITQDQAQQVFDAGEDLLKDVQLAVALIKRYQRVYKMLEMPDPHKLDADALLKKYGVVPEATAQAFRVFCDGIDITDHPDSILGSATEDVLDSGDEQKELPPPNG